MIYSRLWLKCDVNIQNKDGETPLHIYCRYVFNTKPALGTTAIIIVYTIIGHLVCHCRHNAVQVVKVLVEEANGDVNLMDIGGWTPLHYACK